MFLFRGGPLSRGPAAPAGACRPEHFGREGVSWREGDLSPPANGRDTLRSVGRSPSIGRSPRTGITRATGPGCVGPPPIAPAPPPCCFGGGCWWGPPLCAGGTSGPALNRTGSPLGTGTPDQGVLHPYGLVVGVAASHGPVIAPAYRPVRGQGVLCSCGEHSSTLTVRCRTGGGAAAPSSSSARGPTGRGPAGHPTARSSGQGTRPGGRRGGGTGRAGTSARGRSAARSCVGPPDAVGAAGARGHLVQHGVTHVVDGDPVTPVDPGATDGRLTGRGDGHGGIGAARGHRVTSSVSSGLSASGIASNMDGVPVV